MKRCTALFFAAMIVLLTGCGGPANLSQSRPELPFGQELQAALEAGLQAAGGIGYSAAVSVPGYQVWQGAGGVSHQDVPITTETCFSAGSITKHFTAVAVLRMAEAGLLRLDDPIRTWLPEYENIDGSITVRQLLNHTGGIFNFTEHPDYWEHVIANSERASQPDAVLTNFVLEPGFSPGTGWGYSNSGYILLRLIVEAVSEKDMAEVYHQQLWDPYGLDSMALAGRESLLGPVAHGWWDLDGDGAYDDLTVHGIDAFYTGLAGGVFSTPGDLARWSQLLFYEHQVLSPGTMEQMLDFHAPTPGEDLVDGYGLGVVRFSPELFNGLEVWGHGGNAPGYAAGMLYLPDYGVTVAVMDNTEYGDSMAVVGELLSIVTANLDAMK